MYIKNTVFSGVASCFSVKIYWRFRSSIFNYSECVGRKFFPDVGKYKKSRKNRNVKKKLGRFKTLIENNTLEAMYLSSKAFISTLVEGKCVVPERSVHST
jgi:hypothetical protein